MYVLSTFGDTLQGINCTGLKKISKERLILTTIYEYKVENNSNIQYDFFKKNTSKLGRSK